MEHAPTALPGNGRMRPPRTRRWRQGRSSPCWLLLAVLLTACGSQSDPRSRIRPARSSSAKPGSSPGSVTERRCGVRAVRPLARRTGFPGPAERPFPDQRRRPEQPELQFRDPGLPASAGSRRRRATAAGRTTRRCSASPTACRPTACRSSRPNRERRDRAAARGRPELPRSSRRHGRNASRTCPATSRGSSRERPARDEAGEAAAIAAGAGGQPEAPGPEGRGG